MARCGARGPVSWCGVCAIRFDRIGARWSVEAQGLVDMAAEGVTGLDQMQQSLFTSTTQAIRLQSRFALARALKTHVNALGLKVDEATGKNNGQYAPFSWQGS